MGKAKKGGKPAPGGRALRTYDPELVALASLVEACRYEEIEHAARRIYARRHHPFALKALAFSLMGQGRFDEALPVLDAYAQMCPDDAEAHRNRGIALSELMRWRESVISFEKALRLNPEDPDALASLGVAYSRVDRWDDAVPILLKAIELYPGDNVGAIEVLAICLLSSNRFDEAWACYQELYRCDGSNMRALYQLIWTCLHRCDWEDFGERLKTLREGSNGYSMMLDFSFAALSYPGLTARDHLAITRSHAARLLPRRLPVLADAIARPRAEPRRRLKLAYLSADFRYHPVGFVLPELIERHDRMLVEVCAYSIRPDDGSAERRRLVSVFDRFVDAANDSTDELVSRIRGDDIDILVDLQGWTVNNRVEALALRCAPVQVNWLGYPGTMGHPNLADYIIGDPIVTPEAHADWYSESIAQMPHCYLPSDTKRRLAVAPSRRDAGLPEGKFVFCSFNTRTKFNPGVFDRWCEILGQAPDSVLWLTDPGDSAAARLCKEAETRGIAAGRLVFAPRVDAPADHLARIQLADLALDTFPYNSHSSGADVLWTGVPMVTTLGDSFAGRVGASLLTACGLPDLVAETPQDYQALALSLYRDPARLAAVKARLDDRARSPLFDMGGFVSALEALLDRIWEQHLAGSRSPIYR